MRKPRRGRVAGLLCLWVATGAAAQEPAAATGLVLLPDGTPASDAYVELIGDEDFGTPADVVRRAVADLRGRFRVEALPPGEYRWTAVAAHGAPTTGSIPIGGGAPDFHVLSLRRPLKFAGVVVGPDDAPLPGARVVVELDPRNPLVALIGDPFFGSGFSDDVNERAYATATDAFGRFALNSVLPKDYSCPGLVVSRRGYETLRLQAPYGRAVGELRLRLERADAVVPDADGRSEEAFEPTSDEPVRALDAENDAPPEDAERVAGRVVDAAGRPIAGALVVRHALRRAAPNRPIERRGARTGKDGRFALRGEFGRPHRYVVSAPGYATHVAETDPRTASVEFALRDGYSLAGRVVDDAGLPLAGVSVVAEPPPDGRTWRDENDDWRDLAVSAFTEPDGSFCFDGLATPRVMLRASAPDYVLRRGRPGSSPVVDVAAGEVALVGTRLRAVWIRAVDAESHPIEDAKDGLRFGIRTEFRGDALDPHFDERGLGYRVVEDGPFVLEILDQERRDRRNPAAIVTERDLVPGAGPHGADLATAVLGPTADVAFVESAPDRPEGCRVTLRRPDDARVGWRAWLKREPSTTLAVPHGVYEAFVGAGVEKSRFGVYELHRTKALGRVDVGPGGATVVLPPPEPFGVVRLRVASAEGPLRDVVATLSREDGAPLALLAAASGAVALPTTEVAVPLNASSPVRDAFAVAVRLPAVRVRIRVSDDRGRSAERTVDVRAESVVEVAAEL